MEASTGERKGKNIDDLPALILSNGSQYWWTEGKRHRDGDLPAVILSNGSQYWWTEGEKYR
jgi:hypothetical protein